MDDKRKPMRTCIACREKKLKSDLIRLVPCKDRVVVDREKKLPGRGAYICDDMSCAERMLKTGALDRAYRRHFSEDVYRELIQEGAFGRGR